MSETLESMRHKKTGVTKLESVVKTMKVLAAANIGQYEQAIVALEDYTRTIELGLSVYFHKSVQEDFYETPAKKKNRRTYIVVFGSDQGLVGQFNDVLLNFSLEFLATIPGEKCIWAVGERIHSRLDNAGIPVIDLFDVPSSVNAITPLVGDILVSCEAHVKDEVISNLYLIHNRLLAGMNYEPVLERVLPLDQQWQESLATLKWPSNNIPEVLGTKAVTLEALLREQIFISLFKACAHSLASENASRLASMQRAEKNIGELVGSLEHTLQILRQKNIDEEIFDVIAGSEALIK